MHKIYLHHPISLWTGNRLTGATVRLGEDDVIDDNSVCGTVTAEQITDSPTTNNEQVIEVLCGMNPAGLEGRYLSIHILDQQLQLCEVKVFSGDTCNEESGNIKSFTMIITYNKLQSVPFTIMCCNVIHEI